MSDSHTYLVNTFTITSRKGRGISSEVVKILSEGADVLASAQGKQGSKSVKLLKVCRAYAVYKFKQPIFQKTCVCNEVLNMLYKDIAYAQHILRRCLTYA